MCRAWREPVRSEDAGFGYADPIYGTGPGAVGVVKLEGLAGYLFEICLVSV